jgi:hypothetical protein
VTPKTSPYRRLQQVARQLAADVRSPVRRAMWTYPQEKLLQHARWTLDDLCERVAAADTLGWDVRLKATPEGLVVEYVKRISVPLL